MKFTALVAFLLFTAPAFAQEIPSVEQVAGRPIKAKWTNGNEAALLFARSPQTQLSVTFQVTENLCAPYTGDKFKAAFPYRIDLLEWVWTKHSDLAKVGKPLMYTGVQAALSAFAIVTNDFLAGYPDLKLGLPADHLEFTSLKWLPGLENGLNQPFGLESWMSEGMFRNNETGLAENRIVSGAFGLHLKPTSNTTAEVERVDYTFNLLSFEIFYIYTGDVVSWQWHNAQGPCQIAYKPSLSQGQALAELARFAENANFSFKPYLAEQDSLLKTVGTSFVKEDLQYVE